jgi:hypothetical protein
LVHAWTYLDDVGTFDLGHARRFGRDRRVVVKRRVVEAAGGNLVDLKSLLRPGWPRRRPGLHDRPPPRVNPSGTAFLTLRRERRGAHGEQEPGG